LGAGEAEHLSRAVFAEYAQDFHLETRATVTDGNCWLHLDAVKIKRLGDDINPILQSIGKKAGIAFGHRDIIMPQQLLNLVNAGSVINQQAGIGMAQIMHPNRA
jgi:hypothetical protein